MTTTMASTRAGEELVRVDALVKSFGNTQAVRSATFSIDAGEIHALCGHNGAGKSTVVKMLSGQETPDSGAILLGGEELDLHSRQVAQRLGIALVDQELSVVPELTVAENLMLGDVQTHWVNRNRGARTRFRGLLDRVGLEHVGLDQRLSELRIGERQLIEIARALGQDARLVILDEPTATLSDVESEFVYAAVRGVAAAGHSILFVSHRLGEVLDLCDRVTVMRDGAVAGTLDTADLTIDSLIHEMLGDVPHRAGKRSDDAAGRRTVLSISNLSVPDRVAGFDLTLESGEICAVAGQLGSGASDLLRAIAGLLPSATGTIRSERGTFRLGRPGAAARAGIAFVSNDRKSEGLFLDKSVGTNLLATRLGDLTSAGVVRRKRWSTALAKLIELCGIGRDRAGQQVRSLSGGNQQKVFVGRCLGDRDTRVLVLDEPTRGVDVGGRAAIHQLLRNAAETGVAVIFSSTELDEILDLADTVITMHKGVVVQRHDGDLAGAVLLREMTHGGTNDDARS